MPDAVAALREKARRSAQSGAENGHVDTGALAAGAVDVNGAKVVTALVADADAKVLMETADRLKGQLGAQVAIVLGSSAAGKVSLVAAVTPELVARGVKAGSIVKVAAQVAGGGGGGKDTMAQAGGRDPDKLPEALAAARAAIDAALS